ncbi:MAG: hypothetical protein ABIN91_13520 [Mucilaginibacter sp.]|uniref:hypothetical protein n=1 Tax=Mucilaginibacter sp. TaxID=1882438 RepID=UPI0032631A51
MKRDKEKELDNIFREGLQNPPRTANFREDDWDAMEALLDKDKKRGILYFLPIISGIAAMLVLALGWFLISHHDNPVMVKNNPVKQPVYNTPGSTKPIDTVTEHSASVSTHKNTTQGITNTGEAFAINKHVANKGNSINYAISRSSKNMRSANEQTAHNAESDLFKADGSMLSANNTDVLAANIAPIDLSGLNTSNALNTRFPDNNKPEIVSAKAGNKVVKQSYSKRPQLAITVLGSPDINGVSSFSNSMVGTNAGILFSVGITKKLTVSTGALYSKKPYLTSFADYHSVSAYKFKTDPVSVTADCRVLDIPINIDYQVYKRAKNTFSLGTGISSYIMLRENYHYNYDYTGVGPSDYDIANKNKHILGVLNLEATYQYQLNSKFSIGVQPYMKVPLTGIGYSQVKLQSAGIAVGVTWNINPKKP